MKMNGVSHSVLREMERKIGGVTWEMGAARSSFVQQFFYFRLSHFVIFFSLWFWAMILETRRVRTIISMLDGTVVVLRSKENKSARLTAHIFKTWLPFHLFDLRCILLGTIMTASISLMLSSRDRKVITIANLRRLRLSRGMHRSFSFFQVFIVFRFSRHQALGRRR